MTFAERLRELREERNITQKELGAHLGISPRMVSFYESGAHFPRDAKMLIDIAAFFGVTVDYLLGCSQLREEGTLKKLCAEFSVLPPGGAQKPVGFFGVSALPAEKLPVRKSARRPAGAQP